MEWVKKGITGLVVMAVLAVGCTKTGSKKADATLSITITHSAAGNTMVLNTDVQTPLGEPVRYTVFKYYLGKFTLTSADGSTTTLPVSYYLVDESNMASKTISITIPGGDYAAIGFMIGVDSARNVSGVQEGALDPANGMFWTWNSGYIMAKMEGKSALSPAPLQNITFHIGGFRVANSVLRTINMPFGKTVTADGGSLVLQLRADADKWWHGKTDIHIADHPVIMEPGADAMTLADNYAEMFTLVSAEVH